MMDEQNLDEVKAKLERYAFVRDRWTEHEPRTITITDDEAVTLLQALADESSDGM